jgi:hypothetical protein
MVVKRSVGRRGLVARGDGAIRSEHLGMSSENHVRIMIAECSKVSGYRVDRPE